MSRAPARRAAVPHSSRGHRRRNPPPERERWTFLRTPWLAGAEILIAHLSDRPTRVYTERYAVSVCRGAAVDRRATWDGAVRREKQCEGQLLQSGEVYVDEAACGCTGFRTVFIEPGLIVATAREFGLSGAPRFRTTRSGDTGLLAAVTALSVAVEDRASAAEQQSRLTACVRRMLHLMNEPQTPTARAHPVVRARDHLRQRFHETVTLDELADVARLSRYHLLRIFSAVVGLPPHAYQMRLRIERAMALLRSEVPSGAVAGITGFADQSHMTRQFRRLLRVTPAEYARAAQSS